jgi:hypothetical protein
MIDDMMIKEFKDNKQRLAVCYRQFDMRINKKGEANWKDVRKGDSLNII